MQTKFISSEGKNAKPFLKWAGGKGQLLKQFRGIYPDELKNGMIEKYCEPFVGSGAVLFHLLQNFNIKQSLIIDVNYELVLAYNTIKKYPKELIESLKEIEMLYLEKDKEGRKAYFYTIREKYNASLQDFDFTNFNSGWITRTSHLIFLNRTCFNGLFRVNSKGGFNVPHGDYKNPKICNQENLMAVSKIISNTDILCGNYTLSRDFIDDKTFVYFDPPYRPLNQTSSFTSYSKFDFTDKEQLELAEYYKQVHELGAKLLLSNSDPKNTNPDDNFFEDAYSDFDIRRVLATRAINSKASKRGKINELLVLNYNTNKVK